MNKIYVTWVFTFLFSLSYAHGMKTSDGTTIQVNESTSSSPNGKSKEDTEKPSRINYTLLTSTANQMLETIKKFEEAKKEAEGLQQELKKEIFKGALACYNEESPEDLTLNNEFYAMHKMKIKEIVYPRLCTQDNFKSLLSNVFSADHRVIHKQAKKDDRWLEFLLESIIKHDLIPSFQAIFTEQGMKKLAEYFRLIKYDVDQGANKASLFDFLVRDQNKEGEAGNSFADEKDDLRLNSLMEKILLAFNLERRGLFGKGTKFSYRYPWEYSFAYDMEGNDHSRGAILKDLGSDVGNFQNGVIPDDFGGILDQLVNNVKHYFLFFSQNFRRLICDDKIIFENISYFFLPIAHLLLNDKGAGWKEGFKTPEERMKVACDFLKNCVNNSVRLSFGCEVIRSLIGLQVISKNKCVSQGRDLCDVKRCIMKYIDFPDDDEIIDQFKLSLIHAHKKAEKLFSWMDFQKEFFKSLFPTNKKLFFYFFWENKGKTDSLSRGYFKTYFPKFVRDHPDYVMEDYHERKDACMKIMEDVLKFMGKENEEDFLSNFIPIYTIKWFIDDIKPDVYNVVVENYKKFSIKMHEMLNAEDGEEGGSYQSITVNKRIDQETHQQ